MADPKAQNIIIKKIKVEGGHHGGAWKVAYADFVTAMMAFFLLLWLLNVTTEVQRQGIADYFAPSSISSSASGAGGMFGGRTINAPEAKFSDSAPPSVAEADIPPEPSETEGVDDEAGKAADAADKNKDELTEKMSAPMKTKAEQEQQQFKAAEEALKNAISETPELAQLSKSLIIDQTEEGLRIQIVDQQNYSMFPSGSPQMYPQTRKLLEMVGKAVSRLPNKLSLTGHTDSAPFSNPNARDNWDLSAERANASRRVLQASGVQPERVQTVVGRADREPLVVDNPQDPKNRRISIVLLRQSKFSADKKVAMHGGGDDTVEDAPLTSAYISQPAPCPYLPTRTEQRILLPISKEAEKGNQQLSFFTRLGFRRAQGFMYRPNCQGCQQCISYRLVVSQFKPSITQARIARRNQDLWWQQENNPNLLALFGLFTRYQLNRHAGSEMAKFTYADFLTMLESPTEQSSIYTLSRSTQDYMGAMLVDRVADGLSAVYSFYEPEARVRSLGTELILRMVAEAGRLKLPYVYLGYWVPGSLKMEYKARFGPAEILTENGWVKR